MSLGPGRGRWQAGFQREGWFSHFLSWDLLLSKRKLALPLALSPDDISRELLQSGDGDTWPLPLILSLISPGHLPPCLLVTFCSAKTVNLREVAESVVRPLSPGKRMKLGQEQEWTTHPEFEGD